MTATPFSRRMSPRSREGSYPDPEKTAAPLQRGQPPRSREDSYPVPEKTVTPIQRGQPPRSREDSHSAPGASRLVIGMVSGSVDKGCVGGPQVARRCLFHGKP
eukprot:sb/3478257/